VYAVRTDLSCVVCSALICVCVLLGLTVLVCVGLIVCVCVGLDVVVSWNGVSVCLYFTLRLCMSSRALYLQYLILLSYMYVYDWTKCILVLDRLCV